MSEKLPRAIVVFSHIVGLAVIRALGKMKVPITVLHYLPSEMGYVSKYVQIHHFVKNPNESEGLFINDLMSLAGQYKGSLLIPTDDYTVVALSRNKDQLQNNYIVAVEDWHIVKKLIQKQYTYKFAEMIGVPHPKTYLIHTFQDLEAHKKDIGFPSLIKPCEGHLFYDFFKEKMFKINNEDDLIEKYQKVEKLGLKILLQEVIPGSEKNNVNYNSYRVNGRIISEFTAEKVRVDPPFFGSPRVIVSKLIPEIIELGRFVLNKLEYTGFSCMEFKKDERDGQYKLMEINCRNNLSGSLAVKCGINFPWIMYQHLINGQLITYSDFKEKIYWIDLTKDIYRLFKSRKDEGFTLGEYVQPYFSKKVFAIFSIIDIRPFIKRCFFLLRQIFLKKS